MKLERALLWVGIGAILMWLAMQNGLLRAPGGVGMSVTAVPHRTEVIVPVATAVLPGMATAIPWEEWGDGTAVPETIILIPPVTWTSEPVVVVAATPLPPSTGLLAIVARYGEATVGRCMAAMAAGELLDLECRTVAVELEVVGP